MSNSLSLRDQRAALVADARKLLEANPSLDAEREQTFDQIMRDADELKNKIELEERKEHLAKQETELKETRKQPPGIAPHNRLANPDAAESRAFNTWIKHRAGRGRISAGDLAQCEQFFSPYSGQLDIDLRTGMEVGGFPTGGSGSLGGAFVPRLLGREIVTYMKYFCPMRQFCKILPTETGASFDHPTWDPTSLLSTITAEQGNIAELDPTTGKVPFSAWKYPGVVSLTVELLQDAIVDLVPMCAAALGEAIGRQQAAHFEVGSGSSQPVGIVTAAVAFGNNINTSTLSYNNIVDLYYSVDRAYQTQGAFFMSSATLGSVRKLVDSNGRPLMSEFMLPITNVIQEQLLGRPIIVAESMHNYASGLGSGSGTPCIVFAPPQLYVIRDVQGMSIQVNPYSEMSSAQVQVFAWQRADGNYIGPSRSTAYLASA